MTLREYIQFALATCQNLPKLQSEKESDRPSRQLQKISDLLNRCGYTPNGEQRDQLNADTANLLTALFFHPGKYHDFGYKLVAVVEACHAGDNLEAVFRTEFPELSAKTLEQAQSELDEENLNRSQDSEDEEELSNSQNSEDEEELDNSRNSADEEPQADHAEAPQGNDQNGEDLTPTVDRLEQLAQNTFRFNPNLPGDPMHCVRYPALNPQGLYADIDMKNAERLRRLDVVAGILPWPQRRGIRAIVNALRNPGVHPNLGEHPNPTLRAFQKGMEDYSEAGKTQRRGERMKLLLNKLSRANDGQKQQMLAMIDERTRVNVTPEMKKLDTLLKQLELIAGIPQPGQPQSEIDAALQHVRYNPEKPALSIEALLHQMELPMAPEELRVDTVTLRLNSFEPVLECIQANRYENLMKPKEEWAPLIPSPQTAPTGEKATEATFREIQRNGNRLQVNNLGALDRLTVLYAQHTVGPLVDQLLIPQANGRGINPLDLVVVAGRTGREIFEERRREQSRLRASIQGFENYTDAQWERVTPQQLAGRKLSDHDIYLLTRNLNVCETDNRAALTLTKELLAGGLMTGKPTTLFRVDAQGCALRDSMLHLENDAVGYKPMERLKEDRPVVSLWQRFANWAFGAYQEEFDKISQYDAAVAQKRKLDAYRQEVDNIQPEVFHHLLDPNDDSVGDVSQVLYYGDEEQEIRFGLDEEGQVVDPNEPQPQPMTAKQRRNAERRQAQPDIDLGGNAQMNNGREPELDMGNISVIEAAGNNDLNENFADDIDLFEENNVSNSHSRGHHM